MKSSVLIIFLIFSLSVCAQEDEIAKIRERYNAVSQNDSYDYMTHQVELNYMLPAVGLKTKTLKFYYQGEQINPEVDPYDYKYTLIKTVVTWNVSASNIYTVEYLFNEKGQLIFCFDKSEGMYDNHEYRYYFKDSKLIKCIIKSTTEDGAETNYTKSSGFGKEDLSTSESYKTTAAQYLKTFEELNVLDQIH
jgi:hypothetical protein